MDALLIKKKEKTGRAAVLILLVCALVTSNSIVAADTEAQKFTVHLGDYRFRPDAIEVVAGRPVELVLVNDDKITPHNFTLKEPNAGIDLDAKVAAGESTTLRFTPQAAGTYVFYCNKKLLFLKSHRERGMEGKLIVKPAS